MAKHTIIRGVRGGRRRRLHRSLYPSKQIHRSFRLNVNTVVCAEICSEINAVGIHVENFRLDGQYFNIIRGDSGMRELRAARITARHVRARFKLTRRYGDRMFAGTPALSRTWLTLVRLRLTTDQH